jgi:hypothetical protein
MLEQKMARIGVVHVRLDGLKEREAAFKFSESTVTLSHRYGEPSERAHLADPGLGDG